MNLPIEMMADAASWVLVAAGCFFLLAGGIGVLRLPDFYTRTHAAGLIDTLGLMLPLAVLALQMGATQGALKVVLILLLVVLTVPTTTHAIARAARHQDLLEEESEEK